VVQPASVQGIGDSMIGPLHPQQGEAVAWMG
jgi:hypothetical protein